MGAAAEGGVEKSRNNEKSAINRARRVVQREETTPDVAGSFGAGHQRGKSPFNKRTADFYGSGVRAWKTFSPPPLPPTHSSARTCRYKFRSSEASRATIFTLKYVRLVIELRLQVTFGGERGELPLSC